MSRHFKLQSTRSKAKGEGVAVLVLTRPDNVKGISKRSLSTPLEWRVTDTARLLAKELGVRLSATEELGVQSTWFVCLLQMNDW